MKRLKDKNETALLDRFTAAVNKSDKSEGKLFEIREDSFDACPDYYREEGMHW